MTGTETVVTFRGRAEQWIKATCRPTMNQRPMGKSCSGGCSTVDSLASRFPEEYGGAGLTLEHHKAFYDAAHALQRQVPLNLMVSVGMLGRPSSITDPRGEVEVPPPLLRADEEWIQLLSEPSGGSDMAGATTRLTRDGDTYVLNGAKMWSTAAYRVDYGLCLCRSDWDAPSTAACR